MTETTAQAVNNIVSNIKNSVAVDTNIAELKLILGALNHDQLVAVSVFISPSLIFDCLNSQIESQVKNGCEILRIILPTFSSAIVLHDDVKALIRCLSHPNASCKELALDELKRHVTSDEMTIILVKPVGRDLLLGIIECLCDTETSVGKRATELIAMIGKSRMGTRFLCHPDFSVVAIERTKSSEIYRIRLYEALIEISVLSLDHLREIEDQHYFKDLVSSVKTDDVLANLSLLQVISPLASCWHGYKFLSRQGIFDKLVAILDKAEKDEDPLKSLFYPGILKFFGNLGQIYPQQLAEDFKNIVNLIFKLTDSIEESIFITALETVGMIALTRNGKNVLMTEPSMSACMKRVYDSITQVPADWRIRGLGALSNIIHVEEVDTKSDFAAVVQSWFEEMNPLAFDTVAEMAKQPFPDIELAALNVLIELGSMKWGQTKIASNPSLVDFLVNGSQESPVEVRAAKMRLLKVLATSETSPSVFGDDVLKRIKSKASPSLSNGNAVPQVEMMSV